MNAASVPAQDPRAGALTGVRVLEFAALIAGPSCARYLADHGAEVIKVERHPAGDVSRVADRNGGERSAWYVQYNGGKQGMCIDLARPEGRDIVRQLVAKSDVVIEAFTPGVMARLGLGYDDLAALNPTLVMCSISGFGQTGPNAKRPGYAHMAHAMSGWVATQFLHRDPPEEPRGPGMAIADVVTGITAFGAICAALFRRERTGRGEHVDIALFDSLFAAIDGTLQRCLLGAAPDVWYHPVHKTLDGYVTANIGPDFRAWQNVCKAMGREDLLTDARFSTQDAVNRHRDAATSLVQEWLLHHTSEEADRILTAHHVVCGVVKTVEEAVCQPQVKARGLLNTVDDPVLGQIDVIGSPVKFREATVGVTSHAPMLGEHNEAVLRGLLGFDDERIARLREQGVLRSAPS